MRSPSYSILWRRHMPDCVEYSYSYHEIIFYCVHTLPLNMSFFWSLVQKSCIVISYFEWLNTSAHKDIVALGINAPIKWVKVTFPCILRSYNFIASYRWKSSYVCGHYSYSLHVYIYSYIANYLLFYFWRSYELPH